MLAYVTAGLNVLEPLLNRPISGLNFVFFSGIVNDHVVGQCLLLLKPVYVKCL